MFTFPDSFGCMVLLPSLATSQALPGGHIPIFPKVTWTKSLLWENRQAPSSEFTVGCAHFKTSVACCWFLLLSDVSILALKQFITCLSLAVMWKSRPQVFWQACCLFACVCVSEVTVCIVCIVSYFCAPNAQPVSLMLKTTLFWVLSSWHVSCHSSLGFGVFHDMFTLTAFMQERLIMCE